MILEAAVFLAGAVLFLLAVLFFLYAWRERAAAARASDELQARQETLRQQRVEIDLRERELSVWARGLEQEQQALELERAALKMLTAGEQEGNATELETGERLECGARQFPPTAALPLRRKNRKAQGRLKLP